MPGTPSNLRLIGRPGQFLMAGFASNNGNVLQRNRIVGCFTPENILPHWASLCQIR